jgi:hypothetical protein
MAKGDRAYSAGHKRVGQTMSGDGPGEANRSICLRWEILNLRKLALLANARLQKPVRGKAQIASLTAPALGTFESLRPMLVLPSSASRALGHDAEIFVRQVPSTIRRGARLCDAAPPSPVVKM